MAVASEPLKYYKLDSSVKDPIFATKGSRVLIYTHVS